jgi:hypothetical protein
VPEQEHADALPDAPDVGLLRLRTEGDDGADGLVRGDQGRGGCVDALVDLVAVDRGERECVLVAVAGRRGVRVLERRKEGK